MEYDCEIESVVLNLIDELERELDFNELNITKNNSDLFKFNDVVVSSSELESKLDDVFYYDECKAFLEQVILYFILM